MKRVALIPAALAALAACTQKSEPQSVAQALHPEAVAEIEALLAEKEARTPEQRKISSQLLYARNQVGTSKGRGTGRGGSLTAPGSELVVPLVRPDASGRVLVDVKGEITAALLDKIIGAGGEVVRSSPAQFVVRARVPLAQLEALAADPAVRAIGPALAASTWRADSPRGGAKFRHMTREERVSAMQAAVQQAVRAPRPTLVGDPATNAGSVTSEGSTAHGAERARKFFNTSGAGVRVGVLSDSDDFKERSIATGDLPPDTFTVPGEDGRPGSGEGTAMMEIVHDVAPGAKLFFATAFNGPESFAANIRTLRFTYHCDIIIDDVIYFFESPYQDDIIAQAVNDVTDDGGMFFSSAGNGGHYDDGTSGTWEGDFKSGGKLATLPSGYTVHDFGAGVISNRIEGFFFAGPLYLHWSDPGTLDTLNPGGPPGSSNDYDLFVLDPDLRHVLVASTDIQAGHDLPFEYLGYLFSPDLRVVIAKKPNAKVRALHLILYAGEFGLSTPGSTYGHNSAAAAFGVAAVDVFEASGGEFFAGPTTPIELYSSDGYRRIFYDRRGQLINGDDEAGATFAGGGGQLRLKPDLTAADGVHTTLPSSSGLNPFFGTSAAAPHAAAVAALIWSAVPSLSTSRIRRALTDGALDIMARGVDRNSGAGIVSAMGSLQQAGAKAAAFLELGTVTATGSTGPFIFPGGGGRLTVQLINNGGAAATRISASLQTSFPGVTITGGVSAYPDLAAGAAATNVTPFTFSVASSVSCGAKIPFVLTATFTGRGNSPAGFGLGVQTGRPKPRTSYAGAPAAIPDDDLAGVNVPLTVSGMGIIGALNFSLDGTACTSAAGATTVGLDHTWVGDLAVNLTSPAGTTVTLMNRPGGTGNSGNNFCQTVLDDSAANAIQSIASGGAPWTGSFQPSSPLSTFDGENGDGTWVLNVSDNAFFDVGRVRAFTLKLAGFECGP